ncbi:putative nuclease S1 precursor [Mycena indigotica]|uniref:Putative nuclease S1 n=1 Tax=Mycena indigotica TaxID=2126181 RepID=A0A8H6ST96_9AGAR|nr:putative nuclease S1 precursor [Mycena indigotica]KAF7303550.1 putative nuclease S1 precursor [Mycena indigotica]
MTCHHVVRPSGTAAGLPAVELRRPHVEPMIYQRDHAQPPATAITHVGGPLWLKLGAAQQGRVRRLYMICTPLIAAVVWLGAARGVRGWGTLGHATVAYVAQNFVEPEVAAWAQGVLNDTSSSYFANIASWADTFRATAAGKWSAPLHFIDAQDSPPTSCNVNFARDCTAAGCSISAVANYTQRVGDGRLTAANTAEALKFLVHFIGDITQPLHDEALDVGGNTITVTFDGFTTDNLHSDWDTFIPQKLIGGSSLADAQAWATTLTTSIKSGAFKALAPGWVAASKLSDPVGSATAWAADANALVCTVVMPNGVAALQQGDLFPTYYNGVVPTVELQIAKGGYRLADWLNKIFAANIAKRGVAGRAPAAGHLPDLSGRDLLPSGPEKSREMLIREAMDGGGCGCSKRSSHDH